MSKATAARFVPHPENECQQSLNDVCSCMLGNQGITRIYEIITILLTALVLLNTEYKRQNIDSKITDVTTRKVITKESLDVNWLILIKYHYQTAKARALYKPTNGPAWQPSNYPPNSEGLGDVHWTVAKLTVHVQWQPGPRIWRLFSSDPDPVLMRRSGTIPNTTYAMDHKHNQDFHPDLKTDEGTCCG